MSRRREFLIGPAAVVVASAVSGQAPREALDLPTATAESLRQDAAASASTKRVAARPETVVLAAAAGAALDSDLATGGRIDDTVALPNQASGARPIYSHINGVAPASGVNVYGITTIECVAGGGLYWKVNSGRAILRNVHRSLGSITDRHITLRACLLNGKSRTPNRRAGEFRTKQEGQLVRSWIGPTSPSFSTFGVRHLNIENTILRNMRTFGVWVGNAQYIHPSNVMVDNGTAANVNRVSDARNVHFGVVSSFGRAMTSRRTSPTMMA